MARAAARLLVCRPYDHGYGRGYPILRLSSGVLVIVPWKSVLKRSRGGDGLSQTPYPWAADLDVVEDLSSPRRLGRPPPYRRSLIWRARWDVPLMDSMAHGDSEWRDETFLSWFEVLLPIPSKARGAGDALDRPAALAQWDGRRVNTGRRIAASTHTPHHPDSLGERTTLALQSLFPIPPLSTPADATVRSHPMHLRCSKLS